MKSYKLNADKSKAVYDRGRYEMKECYRNIFHAVTKYYSQFASGEWKVAYGYVTSIPGLLVRHCFIIDEAGEVIDPTIYTNPHCDTDRLYYAMYVFENIEKYARAIEREGGYPALCSTMRPCERRAQEWAAEHGFALCG